MKKIYSLSFLMIASLSFGQNFTATYDFAGVTTTSGTTDPTAVPTAANMTFSSFTSVNADFTGTGSSGPGRFSFDNQAQGAANGLTDYAALTGAIDLNKYFQVVLSPATGYKFDLTKLTFRAQRSGTGVRTYAVRTSADNFGANLGVIVVGPATADGTTPNPALSAQDGNIFFFVEDASGGQNGSTINIATINDRTEPLTVRFYGWNSEGTGGTFSIDDVVFTGLTESATNSTKDNAIAGLKVFPNPLNGNVLNITSDNNATRTVAIYDVIGKQVVNTTTANQSINVNLNSGVYMVKITEEGKTATKKLVVQ
jgi:hypothetical protein